MVSVLSVCEIVGGQIRSRENYLVIHPVELHVLQTPPLVDPLGYMLLSQSRQVWRVVHADFYALWPELVNEGG